MGASPGATSPCCDSNLETPLENAADVRRSGLRAKTTLCKNVGRSEKGKNHLELKAAIFGFYVSWLGSVLDYWIGSYPKAINSYRRISIYIYILFIFYFMIKQCFFHFFYISSLWVFFLHDWIMELEYIQIIGNFVLMRSYHSILQKVSCVTWWKTTKCHF